MRRLASGAAALPILLAALLSGLGWLYVLRGLGWLNAGPSVGDSLPLLQLAGFDAQPLARVLIAWATAGLLTGIALHRLGRLPRGVLAGALGVALLLFASQASFALARNFRLSQVLFQRAPGAGPWLEGLVFGAACALPRSGRGRRRGTGEIALTSPPPRAGHLLLSRSERRDAAEHDGDREHMGQNRGNVPAQ